MNHYYLGIDIGGTKSAVIAGTDDMKILRKEGFATETHKGPGHTIGLLLNTASEIAVSLGIDRLKAIGISCGGPLDSRKGIVQSPPNLPGWDDIPIVDLFRDKFRVPVYLQNDANACALAEWKFGAGRGTQNMVFLTFGTGMGAGLFIDGRLYSGTNDNAGEVGHIRLNDIGRVGYGKAGSFEGFCSGGGIAQLARIKTMEKLQMGEKVSFCNSINELQEITALKVAEAANKGDSLAIEIYELCGTYLGEGLSVIIDILNPECIVIGSIFVRSGNLLIRSMEKAIEKESLSHARKVCRIVPAELEETIGDIASLSVAADKALN